jgi:glycosyltransferase involved in cell wall biosynthesis/O-antigen/teichoic acid export membrane protein
MSSGLALAGAPEQEQRASEESSPDGGRRLHLLVLTDRDWQHPQGGGTGTNLFGQVMHWLHWGHRVTVIAAGYEGGPAYERHGALTIHRCGGRSTVFPRTIWRQLRGLVPDADFVLEVINGITFLTPLWLHTPRVALVHHIHRDHYAAELGRPGKVAAFALETAPLRWLYRDTRFIAVSHATADDVAAHGIPRAGIVVNHNGVETDAFWPGRKADDPMLLFLGRLKRYKRVELILDAVARLPSGRLHIAGDGDHRKAIEERIAEYGLQKRVTLHGAVDEPTKLRLLQSAWVNLSASVCEGWGLTVTEAAACGTPTVAIATGGLHESIVDGETGLLVDDTAGMARAVEGLLEDEPRRRRMGEAALHRARGLTWDRTARRTLEVLSEERERVAATAPAGRDRALAFDIAKAGTLALAVVAANAIQLVFTIVFAHLLGASGYGELAALVSAFLILSVPAVALQITAAREVSTALVGGGEAPVASIRRWLSRLVAATAAVTVVAVLLRAPIGSVLGADSAWAAATVLPAGCLFLVLSVQRGALQGYQRYGLVAGSLVVETGGRIAFGLLLWAVGLGVAGAFYGTVLAELGMVVLLGACLRRSLPRDASLRAHGMTLRGLIGQAGAPVVALTLVAVIQNVDVIVVRHNASGVAAGAYAAAAVTAKAIIWLAVGLGLYLLPEVARRARAGADARPMLIATIVLIAATALPMLAVFGFAARPVLGFVYGDELAGAAGALPLLGLAMTLLACAYLAVQYLLALGRTSFLWLLGVAAVVEPVLLAGVGAHLVGIAATLLGLQFVLAAGIVALSLRPQRPRVSATA